MKEPQEPILNILALMTKLMIFTGILHLLNLELEEATYDAYQEVRNNKITREEAVSLVKKYDAEFPQRYFQEFLDYININEATFGKLLTLLDHLIYGKKRKIIGLLNIK